LPVVGSFSSQWTERFTMDRQRIIAIVLVALMVVSSVAYVVSFL
jgi:flagellar basal body-associated protein FliL